ncbi:hypothetical protein DRN72_03990 [Methanosarcinales archaeon]|nr:MAG: hypothetical protein DRN72_03990 [Methanosarcinales archaeon]
MDELKRDKKIAKEEFSRYLLDRVKQLEEKNNILRTINRQIESEFQTTKLRQEQEIKRLRGELSRLRSLPLIVGDVIDVFDDGRAIVKINNGSSFLVKVSQNVSVGVGDRVALNQQTLAVLEVLPPSYSTNVKVAEVIDDTGVDYSMIGGLDKQIEEIKEVVELPLTSPELFEEVGITPPQGVLLYGPPGTGKTLLAKAVAHSTSAKFIKIVGSELVQKYIGEGARLVRELFQLARDNPPSIIFIDELDSMDSSGLKAVSALVKESPVPIVMIADDVYSRRLVNIRQKCDIIKFYKIRSDSLAKFLREIAAVENIDISEASLKKIATSANGDVRAALNDLGSNTFGDVSYRDVENKIFETIKIILKTKNPENVKIALKNSDRNLNEIIWWLEENIKNEYEKKEEIAKAYDALSLIDIIQARIIKRQSWSLQSYIPDMITTVALSKEDGYKKFVNYNPPAFFLRYGKRKSKRLDSLLGKMSKELHVSKRTAMSYLYLTSLLMKKKTIEIDEENRRVLAGLAN